MKIAVTQEDIDQGRQDHCRTCPLALAIQRDTGKSVYVGIGCYLLEGHNLEILPETAEMFRSAFDAGFPVQPFEFELEVPSHEH